MGPWKTARGRRTGARLLAVIAAGVLFFILVGTLTQVHAQSNQPVTLAVGQWTGADNFHTGSGKVLLVRLPDGQRFLRFEEFKVTNGPDLYVYLSGHPAPRNRAQLHEGAAFEVAVLKGNVGNQNYALPADLDLAKFKSAVIYCKRFSVIFATAELTARP